MKIHLLCFGAIKTPGLSETAQYYRKLLSPWVTWEEHELSSEENEKAQLGALSRKIGMFLEKNPLTEVFLLSERGRSLASEAWADCFSTVLNQGKSQWLFCVGGSYGFSDDGIRELETVAKSARRLSLGPQTLSHDLARVVLMEQIYRAWAIIKRHPYHHG